MEKVKNNSSLKEIIKRKLPPSSYEVIQLPTPTKKLPTKVKNYEEQGIKRQKVTSSVASRAEEFRLKLDAKFPSFTKVLVKSHVSGSFWMGLPHIFCKKHLPQDDTIFTLENEDGKEYQTKFLAEQTAFSGGWRGYSLSEKMSVGDVLVFHLVTSTKFKVYRFRDCDSDDVSGARIAPNLDSQLDQSASIINPGSATVEMNTEIHRASSPRGIFQDEDQEVVSVEQNVEMHQASSPSVDFKAEDLDVLSENDYRITQKENDEEQDSFKVVSENPEPYHFPSPASDNYGFGTFEDFVSVIDNLLTKYYELPHDIKWAYYQLCSSQNALLHVKILKGISPIMLAGCIIETVEIANAMRSCEPRTFQTEHAAWDEKLKSLEAFGMNVKFLCARLHSLQRIACYPEAANNQQHFMYLSSEITKTAHKIKSLKDELSELIRVSERRADDIEKLKTIIEQHELRFQEQVSAPW